MLTTFEEAFQSLGVLGTNIPVTVSLHLREGFWYSDVAVVGAGNVVTLPVQPKDLEGLVASLQSKNLGVILDQSPVEVDMSIEHFVKSCCGTLEEYLAYSQDMANFAGYAIGYLWLISSRRQHEKARV